VSDLLHCQRYEHLATGGECLALRGSRGSDRLSGVIGAEGNG
jgi:hypothetical protein